MLTKTDLATILMTMKGRARIWREAEANRIARYGIDHALVKDAQAKAAEAEAVVAKLRVMATAPDDMISRQVAKLRAVYRFIENSGQNMFDRDGSYAEASANVIDVIETLSRLGVAPDEGGAAK